MTKIKKMPSKKLLESFLEGLHGEVKVHFDTIRGQFVRSISVKKKS
jgi:hypothetical protein